MSRASGKRTCPGVRDDGRAIRKKEWRLILRVLRSNTVRCQHSAGKDTPSACRLPCDVTSRPDNYPHAGRSFLEHEKSKAKHMQPLDLRPIHLLRHHFTTHRRNQRSIIRTAENICVLMTCLALPLDTTHEKTSGAGAIFIHTDTNVVQRQTRIAHIVWCTKVSLRRRECD